MTQNDGYFLFSTEIRKGITHLFRKGKKWNPQNNLTPVFYRSVHFIPEWIFVLCHPVDKQKGLRVQRPEGRALRENQKYLPSHAPGPVLARTQHRAHTCPC
jgi:hypothetical protein|nr:hypothetical protein [Cronobacter sakazakii]